MLRWLPSNLIYVKPYILDICIVSARSVAETRDNHYHNPPDYLVLQPEDTQKRTKNLQQTNTNGDKWQGNNSQFQAAQQIVKSWGNESKYYQPTREYQKLLRQLINLFPYRLDTNFAKIDRIVHPEIESFKEKVLEKDIKGISISEWAKLLGSKNTEKTKLTLQERLFITDINPDDIIL
ncbi:hypothetical protein [Hydrocoleum sp. CS-953]|uniref:hypothetical protein n=1 Tax=Hydrocoleum sp. CS-953 TaxID=1671698 RepID=UPI001FEF0448|nr:hypothetical protein [Hydrocoleum sp. CS-953]